MRCQDLTRELATPTGALTPAELASHLADCPSCAAWSRQADRLDRAWDATRLPEPSPDTLDALWARTSAALDAPAPLRLVPVGSKGSRRRWAGLAAAAAILIAVALPAAWRRVADGPVVVQVPRAVPASRPVEGPRVVTVEFDQIAICRIGADDVHVDRLDDSPEDLTLASNTQHDLFNAMESAGVK